MDVQLSLPTSHHQNFSREIFHFSLNFWAQIWPLKCCHTSLHVHGARRWWRISAGPYHGCILTRKCWTDLSLSYCIDLWIDIITCTIVCYRTGCSALTKRSIIMIKRCHKKIKLIQVNTLDCRKTSKKNARNYSWDYYWLI